MADQPTIATVSPIAAPHPPPAPTAKHSASNNSLTRGFNNSAPQQQPQPRQGRSLSESSIGSESTVEGGDGQPGPLHKGPSHLDERQTRRSKIMMRAIAFFYHLSLSITFTVWTELLLDDFGGDFSKASDFLGMCNGLERGIQFLSAPFLGNLSDCLGRQPVMIFSLLLHLLALLIVILKPNAKAVMAYYIINGVSNVTWAMLNAIVADLSVGREGLNQGALTQQYGRLGMAVGFALIVGPLIGPRLQKVNVLYPLYGSMVALLISVILGYAMAESLPPQNKNAFKLASSNPFWALKKALKYRGFLLLAAPFFLTQMSEVVYQFIVLYTKKRLHWDYVLLGMYIAGLCLIIAVVQGNLRYVVPRLLSEKGCVLWGSFFHGASMLIMGGAVNSWVMLAMFPPRMLAATKNPGLMGLMAKSVVHEDQGVLQGSIMSLRVLAKAVGSPLFGKAFSHGFKSSLIQRHGSWVTGITFFIAAGLDFLGLGIAALVFKYASPSIFTPPPEGAVAPHSGETAASSMEEGVELGHAKAPRGQSFFGGDGKPGAATSNGTASNGHGPYPEGEDGEEKRERDERVERAMLRLESSVDDVTEAMQL